MNDTVNQTAPAPTPEDPKKVDPNCCTIPPGGGDPGPGGPTG